MVFGRVSGEGDVVEWRGKQFCVEKVFVVVLVLVLGPLDS